MLAVALLVVGKSNFPMLRGKVLPLPRLTDSGFSNITLLNATTVLIKNESHSRLANEIFKSENAKF